MHKCIVKGCGSYAVNEDPNNKYCDKCLYKVPLLDILAIVHRDGGHFTNDHGLKESVEVAEKKIFMLLLSQSPS